MALWLMSVSCQNSTQYLKDKTMRFQKTIYLDDSHLALIQAGMMTIPKGQWVKLAWCDKPSRWVGISKGGSVWACHYPMSMRQFTSMCKNVGR
jgi:hypothetical protein